MFLVGYFGDWVRAAQVLLEPDRVQWNTPSRFKAWERIAEIAGNNTETADSALRGVENQSVDRHWDASGVNISLFASGCHGGYAATSVAGTLKSSGGDIGGGSENLVNFWNGNDYAEALTCSSDRQLMPDKARLQCVIESVSGCDMYNHSLSGAVSKTLNSAASDADHIPTIICRATQQGNAETMVDACPTITEAAGTSGNNQPIICLNNQGGSVMSVEASGSAGTLRANTHGNEQIVCSAVVQTLKIRGGKDGGGKGALVQDNLSATLGCNNDQTLFIVHGAETPISNSEHANPCTCNHNGLENCVRQPMDVISCNSKKMGLDIGDELCGTLNATDYKEPQIVCYENHPNDSRVTEMGDCCQTISSRAGTGGGNLPLVQECYEWHSQDLRAKKIEDNCGATIPAGMGMGGANMTTPMLVQECYVKTARPKFKGDCETYANTGVAPTVNTFDQGDKRANELVVEQVAREAFAIAENIIGRSVENGGNGLGCQEELAYTQNATGVMGVCVNNNETEQIGVDVYNQQITGDVATTVTSATGDSNTSGPKVMNRGYPCAGIDSTVRRLLPIECERLMAFPDNWTKIPFNGKSADDCPDSPRYKACGNSMCVNVMQWIGEQIDKVDKMVESKD